MEIRWEFLRTRMQNFEINLLNILEDFNSGVFFLSFCATPLNNYCFKFFNKSLTSFISYPICFMHFRFLTRFRPIFLFSAAWKRQKTRLFFYLFRGYKKETLAWKGLIRLLDKAPFFRFLIRFFDKVFCADSW